MHSPTIRNFGIAHHRVINANAACCDPSSKLISAKFSMQSNRAANHSAHASTIPVVARNTPCSERFRATITQPNPIQFAYTTMKRKSSPKLSPAKIRPSLPHDSTIFCASGNVPASSNETMPKGATIVLSGSPRTWSATITTMVTANSTINARDCFATGSHSKGCESFKRGSPLINSGFRINPIVNYTGIHESSKIYESSQRANPSQFLSSFVMALSPVSFMQITPHRGW